MRARRVVPLTDRRRLRGLYHGVRADRPADGAIGTEGTTGDHDEDVVACVADPFVDVADAAERLSALERRFRERGDRRGAFLAVYVRVTDAVGRAIRDGEFADPEWTADYLVTFADYYRRALYAYETNDLAAVPDPWQVAFDAACRGESLVTQDVVLGINAHVNYDLALTLDAVGLDPDRDVKYADHCAVNRILRRLVDEVQDAIAAEYAPGVAAVDESLGRLDESLGFFTLREGRDSAWRSAVALNSRFAARRRLANWILRTASTGLAHLVLAPTATAATADWLRDLEAEERDPTG
jgi:hypothetical protein